MPLDPSIPLSVRPFQGVNILAIQEAQRRQDENRRLAEQDAFEREKFTAARQALAEQEESRKAVGEAYQSAGGNRQELLNQLAQRGQGHLIPSVVEQFNKIDKSSLDLEETQARIDELKRKREDAQKEGVGRFGAIVEALGNDQNAWNWFRNEARNSNGKWGSEEELAPFDAAIAQDPSKVAAITAVLQKKAGAKAPDQMKASDLVQVVGPDGKPTWIEASQAAGKPAYEKPTTTSDRLVEVAGPGGKPVFVKQSEAAGMTPYVKPEKGPATEKKRPVTSKDADNLGQINDSLTQLGNLRGNLEGANATGTTAAIGAGVPNWVTNVTGFGMAAKSKQAGIDLVKQIIGKGLEGGVLRKEDEAKYAKILPAIGDPPEVVKVKLQGLDAALKAKRQNALDALSDAGYDISRFEARAGGSGAPASGGGEKKVQRWGRDAKGNPIKLD